VSRRLAGSSGIFDRAVTWMELTEHGAGLGVERGE
jgi:hypothetical protein